MITKEFLIKEFNRISDKISKMIDKKYNLKKEYKQSDIDYNNGQREYIRQLLAIKFNYTI